MSFSALSAMAMPDLARPGERFTEASVKELRAFLTGTTVQGRGTLPWRLAQRGPELLRLVAEFVLAPKTLLYAGGEDGSIQALEILEETDVSAGSSRVREVKMLALPKAVSCEPTSFWASLTCPPRVAGLAVGEEYLLAAMACGCLRVFSLPTHTSLEVSLDLGVLLPPQTPVVVGSLGLVASRRALYAIDLSRGTVLRELPLPFSARPCVVVEGPSVFVQCDEAVRVWAKSSVFEAKTTTTTTDSQVAPQDLWNPHRQMLVGMAVLPGGGFLATACPEEVRGWAWPDVNTGFRGASPRLLWTLPISGAESLGQTWEVTSLVWMHQPGRLAVLGDSGGSLVLSELELSSQFAKKPCVSKLYKVPGSPPSRGARAAVPPRAGADGELTIWSQAGWTSFRARRGTGQSELGALDTGAPGFATVSALVAKGWGGPFAS
ncbi:unnamed protein product [Polarella glacialis]|uniref:Uncharacterized protein n=1 Tax=Polarella glacialis TaxID=89957 RepID=A0A813FHX6_POLGL|nr:unnamed protein product [Polarella glacialis]